jgi:3-oxoacyl-[acyl-carrier-protein] synthase-3
MGAEDVDALVVVQPRVPEFLMASEATRLQAAIGASRAMTFTVADLGCVSVSAALVTGRALLAGDEKLRTILIAHGSKAPTPRRYRHPVTINGEGGIAFVLTREGAPEMIDISLETDGRFWDLFRVRYRDIPYSQWYEECKSPQEYSFKLAIESRNRFARMNEELLTRHGLELGDVGHFVMQNLSLGAFHFYEEFFDITFAKACKANLQRHGHLGAMDIVLNLHTAMETGEFAEGDLVLVMNNSPVAAWSSMLVRI